MTEIELERDNLKNKVFRLSGVNETLKGELVDAVNELCLRCGCYKTEYLGGPCTDCRFRKYRSGDFSDIE